MGSILHDTQTDEWVTATLGVDGVYGLHRRFDELQIQDVDGSDEARDWYENKYSEFKAHVLRSLKSRDEGSVVKDVHGDRVKLLHERNLGYYTVYL